MLGLQNFGLRFRGNGYDKLPADSATKKLETSQSQNTSPSHSPYLLAQGVDMSKIKVVVYEDSPNKMWADQKISKMNRAIEKLIDSEVMNKTQKSSAIDQLINSAVVQLAVNYSQNKNSDTLDKIKELLKNITNPESISTHSFDRNGILLQGSTLDKILELANVTLTQEVITFVENSVSKKDAKITSAALKNAPNSPSKSDALNRLKYIH